jgi:hypothetical protein
MRIDRLDYGKIEAILFVDENRASRVLLEEASFEQAIEHLKKELAAAKAEQKKKAREEMEGRGLTVEGESMEDKDGFWRS